MRVLDKIHIHQEKQWSDISFQTTNKTTGKHWIVHSPSLQIRGFSENYSNRIKKKNKEKKKKRKKRKKKRKKKKTVSDLPRPDSLVLAGGWTFALPDKNDFQKCGEVKGEAVEERHQLQKRKNQLP